MKQNSLGELEQKVMEILWTSNPCTARDVLNKLKGEKSLAYTTIATILQRLFDKGLVSRTEEKQVYIYRVKVTKEKYTSTVAQSFLKNFINSYGDTAIASFADSIDKLPAKKKEFFLQILESHDKDK
jgi:predicted transcriptional regulator